MSQFCGRCGNPLEDNVRFCDKCGAAVNNSTIPQTEQEVLNQPYTINNSAEAVYDVIKKNRGLLKWVIAAAAGVLVVIAVVIIFFVIFNQPEAKMNRAISDGKISEAYGIYRTEMYGKQLSEETVKALEGYADSIASGFENGSITYSAAKGNIYNLEQFKGYQADLDKYIEDTNSKLNNLNDLQNDLKQADAYYNAKNYLGALQMYNNALELNGDSEEAQKGVSKAQEAYRNSVLTQVEECISAKDYLQAKSFLNSALQNMPGDSVLQKKLDGLEEDQVQSVVDDAYSYTKSGDWNGALKLLEDAQSTYMSNEKIKTAYEDIMNKMPITLKNITTVSSDNVEVIEEAVKDRYGNVYDGCVIYNAYGNAYGLYNLSGKYKTFTATAFVTSESSNETKISVSIYVDDKLVLFKDNITEETKPIEINLDISGKQTMKIVTKDENDNNWAKTRKIGFGDSSFEKIDEAKAEHSSETDKATSKKDD